MPPSFGVALFSSFLFSFFSFLFSFSPSFPFQLLRREISREFERGGRGKCVNLRRMSPIAHSLRLRGFWVLDSSRDAGRRFPCSQRRCRRSLCLDDAYPGLADPQRNAENPPQCLASLLSAFLSSFSIPRFAFETTGGSGSVGTFEEIFSTYLRLPLPLPLSSTRYRYRDSMGTGHWKRRAHNSPCPQPEPSAHSDVLLARALRLPF